MKTEKRTNSNLNKQYPVGVAWYATQNKQPYVGVDALKSAPNAITLIALVITIIVLLILAGVTINLTLGNNGIFKTAQQAAENYTDAQNKELANLNEFENIVEKVTQAPEYTPSLLQLKPGDYVKYDTGVKEVGDNGVATFRVLYDATSEYGLQIISDKNISDVTLGGSDWETAKESYNNAIVTLNDEAMKYKNDKYALDARYVGSNPADKNAENKATIVLPVLQWNGSTYVRPTNWTTDNTGCYASDTNYKADRSNMEKAKIWTTGEYYWLASRSRWSDSSWCYFFILRVYANGTFMGDVDLCKVSNDGDVKFRSSYSNGLRPCIMLKPDITVTSGDGSSEATAYTLGI